MMARKVGLVVWNNDGTRIAHHVAWLPRPDMSEDEFIRDWLTPAIETLERKTGENLFPKLEGRKSNVVKSL